MEFIGICGPIASGKSTLAHGLKGLMDFKGHNSRVMSLAKGVKYLAGLYDMYAQEQYMFNTTTITVHNQAYRYFNNLGYSPELSEQAANMLIEAFKKYPVKAGIKPRELLQYIGTTIGRQTVDEYIWINALKKEARRIKDIQFVFIDDIRFLNESHLCDFLVRIDVDSNRDLYDLRVNKLPAEYINNNHISEQSSLKPADYVIPVDYTLSQALDLCGTFMRF
jgi:hypothetical protein